MKVPTKITAVVGRQILLAQKHSPRLLFIAGITGVVAAGVMACRATLKLSDILDEAEEEISSVKSDLKHRAGQYQKDLTYAYTKNAAKVIKLYAPSVIVGGISIAALTGSHVVLTKRNTSITAAYAAISKAYDEYRERVRTVVGEEEEKQLYSGVTKVEVKKDEHIYEIVSKDPNKWSPYARFFDEASPHWHKNAEVNRLYVQCQQNWANHLLHARGHVFLNEVYDMLGIERSSAGQVVGWVLDSGGDNYIDFGLYEISSSRFINGTERSVLLDFNVDGVVFDKI